MRNPCFLVFSSRPYRQLPLPARGARQLGGEPQLRHLGPQLLLLRVPALASPGDQVEQRSWSPDPSYSRHWRWVTIGEDQAWVNILPRNPYLTKPGFFENYYFADMRRMQFSGKFQLNLRWILSKKMKKWNTRYLFCWISFSPREYSLMGWRGGLCEIFIF